MIENEVVWLREKGRFAFLVHRGAFFSTVKWFDEGIEYEDDIENDDYEFWEERSIEFEPDES